MPKQAGAAGSAARGAVPPPAVAGAAGSVPLYRGLGGAVGSGDDRYCTVHVLCFVRTLYVVFVIFCRTTVCACFLFYSLERGRGSACARRCLPVVGGKLGRRAPASIRVRGLYLLSCCPETGNDLRRACLG